MAMSIPRSAAAVSNLPVGRRSW